MDANLFAAYNYLSSAIAQAFAALIGLTAIFYIFRRQTLRTQMKEVHVQFFRVDLKVDPYEAHLQWGE